MVSLPPTGIRAFDYVRCHPNSDMDLAENDSPLLLQICNRPHHVRGQLTLQSLISNFWKLYIYLLTVYDPYDPLPVKGVKDDCPKELKFILDSSLGILSYPWTDENLDHLNYMVSLMRTKAFKRGITKD